MLHTEVEFTLPCGYLDSTGTLHRHGSMRLARAEDEVELLTDPRVRANHAYVAVLLLSRVLTRVGDVTPVGPGVVTQLFAADFAFLQQLYMRVNEVRQVAVETQCPHCGRLFGLDLVGALV